jgi:outer membrane protein assembly factor BamD (BamD/ComL family)
MMIRFFLLSIANFLLIFSIIFSCKQKFYKAENSDKLRIDSLENEMRLATEKNPSEPDLKLAMYLAQDYQNYDVKYPTDSLSPKFLFKAGQVIENVFEDKSRAAEIYFSIYKKYPKSKAAPYALFMTGNLFHTVHDTVHSVEMLNFFMAKYPDHELKKDAASLIESFNMVADTSSRPVKELPINPIQ